MVTKHGSTFTLDNVDRGILYQLQLNARKATHEEISDAVGVSPSTVRNRIAQLEQANIIETYTPELNYEQAGTRCESSLSVLRLPKTGASVLKTP